MRRNDEAEIASWLTNGALGVVVPHVNSTNEARHASRAAKYPPQGTLSVPGSIPQFGYGIPLAEASRRFNEESVTMLMIESEAAVECVEDIAAVPGADVLFVGSSDLVFDMGLPGGYDHPRYVAALERIASAARAHGKGFGVGGVGRDAQWEAVLALGAQVVLTENDLSMIVNRARERAPSSRPWRSAGLLFRLETSTMQTTAQIQDRDQLRDAHPKQVREAIREGRWDGPTVGMARGYIQTNVAIVPERHAFDFLRFCLRNPKPCPLVEVLEPGDPVPRQSAPGATCAPTCRATACSATGSSLRRCATCACCGARTTWVS